MLYKSISEQFPGWSFIETELKPIAELSLLKLDKIDINKHGLLEIKFLETDDCIRNNLGNILEWYYQRRAAEYCQQCGNSGYRRKIFPDVPTLCHRCYVFRYNDYFDEINKEQ